MADQSGTTVTSDSGVDAYLASVTAGLGAVPGRDDLVTELRAHLVEVQQDNPGVPLVTLLGEPAEYAAEMRAASGLVGVADDDSWTQRLARVRRRSGPALAAFGQDMRRVWWGVRGLGAGLFAVVLWEAVRFGLSENDLGSVGTLTAPGRALEVIVGRWGNAPAMTVLVVALVLGVVASVWLGGVMTRHRTPPWLQAVVVGVGALLGLWIGVVFIDVVQQAALSDLFEPLGELSAPR